MILKTLTRFGWSDGKWGNLNELSIPIADRGLNFADGLFETILILNGVPQLLYSHIDRWEKSAYSLGLKSPPSIESLACLIQEGIKIMKMENKNGSVRLNWSRGNSFARGIDIVNEEYTNTKHSFWLEINISEPSFHSVSTIISQKEKRNPFSVLSYCKTFAYGQSIQAKKEAKDAGFDDALLLNTNNQICCGTTANLIVKRNGNWLTPRSETGCLPGVMRQQGLNKGVFKEAYLDEDVTINDQWLLINSLSCHPIKKIGDFNLDVYESPKDLWQSLLST